MNARMVASLYQMKSPHMLGADEEEVEEGEELRAHQVQQLPPLLGTQEAMSSRVAPRLTVYCHPLEVIALETMNVFRATSKPSTSLGREKESEPENIPVEANSTKEGMSLISNSRPEFNIMAVVPVALLSSLSTSAIWIDCEDSVPAGQMPRATVGA